MFSYCNPTHEEAEDCIPSTTKITVEKMNPDVNEQQLKESSNTSYAEALVCTVHVSFHLHLPPEHHINALTLPSEPPLFDLARRGSRAATKKATQTNRDIKFSSITHLYAQQLPRSIKRCLKRLLGVCNGERCVEIDVARCVRSRVL